MLKNIITDTNPVFLKWAIDKIVCWTNETIPENLVQIHGTKDRILPFRFVMCEIKVSGGGHFMTVNKANELSQILRGILNN